MSPFKSENKIPEWEDNKLKHLLMLAWPIAVSTVSYSVMSLVDTLFVSRISTSAIAGVGLAITVSFAMICFAFGLLRAVKVVVSQARGAGRDADAPGYLGAGLLMGVVFGVFLVALSPLVGDFLVELSATPAAGEAARNYFVIRMLFSPAILCYVAFREYRYGCGDSKLPMVAALAGNGLNIVLDYLFIVVLGWGVAGAAWATVAGACLEVGVMVVAEWKTLPLAMAVTRRHLKAVWEIGMPSGIQFTLEMGAFTLLATMISTLDEVEMASHQVALQVIHFAFLPSVAFGEAASVMVGEVVGAGYDKLVKPVSWLTTRLVTAYMVLCCLVLVLFGTEIAGLFGAEPEFIARTVLLFHVACVFLLFDGTNIVCRCVLRGIGDVRYPAMVGIVMSWVFTPPLMWLLGYKMGWGAAGGWVGLCIEVVLGTLILVHRLARGGWSDAAERSRERLKRQQDPIAETITA